MNLSEKEENLINDFMYWLVPVYEKGGIKEVNSFLTSRGAPEMPCDIVEDFENELKQRINFNKFIDENSKIVKTVSGRVIKVLDPLVLHNYVDTELSYEDFIKKLGKDPDCNLKYIEIIEE